MERRSTNDIGYTHNQGDFTAQIGSSHGVRLSGGSTGGVVEAVGDDTNVTLRLRGQGAGGVVIGNSSQGVSVAGPSTFSGTAFNVNGASSIVLRPTSTAGISIGNSSNPIMINGSTLSIQGTSMTITPSVLFSSNVRVQGASSIVLSPTSTAGITIGNSTNENPIAITGSSIALNSTHVNINSSRTVIGASTTPLILVQRSRIDFTVPALSSNAADNSVEVAVTGLTTNALIFIQQRQVYNSTITAGIHVEGYCSTAGALRLNIYNLSVSSVSGSTMSADLWRIECPVAV